MSFTRTATSDPSRALRIEVVYPLWITSHLGTETQRTRAREVLEAMVQDTDELVASAARLVLDQHFEAAEVEAHWTAGDPIATRE